MKRLLYVKPSLGFVIGSLLALLLNALVDGPRTALVALVLATAGFWLVAVAWRLCSRSYRSDGIDLDAKDSHRGEAAKRLGGQS